jgi:hypothetical protein
LLKEEQKRGLGGWREKEEYTSDYGLISPAREREGKKKKENRSIDVPTPLVSNIFTIRSCPINT